jgi:UDP-N-acetyl-D-mannosaminuronate dehydrogenase
MRIRTVCVIGLGYVGLPLAKAFSKHLKVICYDINEEKIKYLKNDNNEDNLDFTSDAARIKQSDFVLISSNKVKRAKLTLCKISSRNCWTELEEGCNRSLRINSISWSY